MPANHVLPLQAVLFDLDGTLLDTAPDLAAALNVALQKEGHDTLPYETIRPYVSYGAAGLLKLGFGDSLADARLVRLKSILIESYQQNIANQSALFDGMETVLSFLEETGIPWGIVTNKPKYLTDPLLEAVNLFNRASCVVSGDEVINPKPHPEAIHKACRVLNIVPKNCVYIGDAERDIRAGNLAGCRTLACEFGYIPNNEDIAAWEATDIVKTPENIQQWVQQNLAHAKAC